MQPLQKCVPEPAVCLQLAVLVHIVLHDGALPQVCCVEVAPVLVSWQLPFAQFWVHDAPVLHVTWHPSLPLQFVVHVEPVQSTWHPPVAGQFMMHVPLAHEHCRPAMHAIVLVPVPPPEPPEPPPLPPEPPPPTPPF